MAAQTSGRFAEEIVTVTVPQRRGEPLVVDTDEHPRADTTVESLAKLRPIRLKTDPDATITAGNASGPKRRYGPQHRHHARTYPTTRPAAVGADGELSGGWRPPKTMGIGPVPATAKALGRVGLTVAEMGVIELNEAFAAQALAVIRTWDLAADDERTNPNGSGISLSHPPAPPAAGSSPRCHGGLASVELTTQSCL